jgi:septal ring factor EnvC (AmiA/AmiB activator)
MLRWPFIATALAVIALGVVLLLVSIFQNQRHLRSVQRELDQAREQIVQSRAASAELEKSVAKLKTELDAVNKAHTQLQGHLDEANSDNDHLRKELDASQSQLKEKEAQAQQLTTELERARREAEGQPAAEREASKRQFEAITDRGDRKTL